MQTLCVPLHVSLRELSHPVRLEIIRVLADGPLTVNQLCEKLREPQPNISKHLMDMRESGIVSARRDGVLRHYSLNRGALMTVATQLVELLSDGAAA
jgi:DNA-binding transcriptional ArsR family regulator